MSDMDGSNRGKKRKYSAVTCVNSLTTSYEWTLRNFSNLPCVTGEHIKSPTFSFPEIEGKNFHLSTYPGGEVPRCEGFVSIYVNNCSDEDQKVRFSLILVSQKEGPNGPMPDLVKRCTKPETIQSRRGLGWAKFILREDLLRPDCHLIQNDTIVVRCEMEIILEPQTTELTDPQPTFPAPPSSLSEDLSWLLETEEHSDVVIRLDGGEEFKAHKCILSSRSEVFRAMFRNGMQETGAPAVTLEEVSPDVFRSIMRYMYTGCVPTDSFHTLSETLSAADRFALLCLKSLCEQRLFEMISEDNAVEMLVLASMHAAPCLRDACVKYVVENFRSLSVTGPFRDAMIRYPEVIQTVLLKLGEQMPLPESKRAKLDSAPTATRTTKR